MKAKRMEYVSPYVIAANKAATNRTRNAKAFLRAERQKILNEETALEYRMEQRRNRNKSQEEPARPVRSTPNKTGQFAGREPDSPYGVYDFQQTSSPTTAAPLSEARFLQQLARMESPGQGIDYGHSHGSPARSPPQRTMQTSPARSHGHAHARTPVRAVTPRAGPASASGSTRKPSAVKPQASVRRQSPIRPSGGVGFLSPSSTTRLNSTGGSRVGDHSPGAARSPSRGPLSAHGSGAMNPSSPMPNSYGSSPTTSTAQQVDPADFSAYLNWVPTDAAGPTTVGDPAVAQAVHSWDARRITRSTSPLRDPLILDYLASIDAGDEGSSDGEREENMVKFVEALAEIVRAGQHSSGRRHGGRRGGHRRSEKTNKLHFQRSGLGSTGATLFSDASNFPLPPPRDGNEWSGGGGMLVEEDGPEGAEKDDVGLIKVDRSSRAAQGGMPSTNTDAGGAMDESSMGKVLRALQTMERRNNAAAACLETDRAEAVQAEPRGPKPTQVLGAPPRPPHSHNHGQPSRLQHVSGTSVLIPLQAPPLGETFEISVDRLLPVDRGGGGVNARDTVSSPALSTTLKHQYQLHPALTPLAPSYEVELGFKHYRQQFLRARKSRDVVFRSQSTTLGEEISKATNSIFEDLLGSVTAEIDGMFAELAEKVVGTI